MALAARWHAAWIEADGKPAEVPAREPGATKGPAQTKPTSPGSGLHEWMRRLGDWLRPAGLRKDRKQSGGGTGTQTDWSRVRSARNTGGLSVRRLVTLREFYNVQKAFLGREKFADGIWDHADFAGRQPVQRTLDALERLREQRVKQLASRIAAAALGLAPAPPTPGERSAQGREAVRAARMRLSKLEPRFAPCHAVVIERLSNYTPDQLRTRRENRQLMQWSSSKVQKYLAEACQLNGLHLREVPPAYTSRQDSRTGAPGLRCVDVPLKDFLREGSFWQRDAEKVRRKSDRERKAAEQLLLDTFDSWKAFAAHPTPDQAQRLAHGSVRLLRAGGDVFVSAHPDSPAAKGLQADLNAAANIGLKALLDPDWPGSWWLVPCVRGTHAPKPDAVKGCPLFSDMKQLTPRHGTAGVKKGKAEREFVNLWRDPGNAPLTTGDWVESTTYWAGVQRRVAAVLRPHNGLSDARPSSAHDVRGNHEPEDDLVV
jgi:IS605 OrfB family transposase